MRKVGSLFYDTGTHRLGAALRGHLLLFDRREPPGYPAAAGARLLVLFVVLELIVGPRGHGLAWLGLSAPASLRVPLLLATSIVAIRLFARMPLADVGFVAWRNWTPTEKLYFVQVVLLANVAFALAYAGQLESLRQRRDLWPAAAPIAALEFLWGFYQELRYRGILQTELTRRFGNVAGPLIANAAFTFGPLHFYHFDTATPSLSRAMIFAAIFCIGLLFSFIFQRTRNLWLVGTFHGIGNAYINGAATLTHSLS